MRAVAAQTVPPARMLMIDDRSTDGTFELLQTLAGEIPFLSVFRAPERAAAPDRLALAIEAKNFNAVLERLEIDKFTHVMKLDGDVELPPDYLEALITKFDADPHLGLAGGVLVEPTSRGETREIMIPRHHVHGALKLYSRTCFESIGGVQERLGWDTIDETYARMRGFGTRSFREIVAVHHKPLATADGTLRGRARHGECAWVLHYGFLWVLLRAVKVTLVYRPRGIAGLAFLYGYISAAGRGVEQVPDSEFRRFTRDELRNRLLTPVRVILRRLEALSRGRLGSAA